MLSTREDNSQQCLRGYACGQSWHRAHGVLPVVVPALGDSTEWLFTLIWSHETSMRNKRRRRMSFDQTETRRNSLILFVQRLTTATCLHRCPRPSRWACFLFWTCMPRKRHTLCLFARFIVRATGETYDNKVVFTPWNIFIPRTTTIHEERGLQCSQVQFILPNLRGTSTGILPSRVIQRVHREVRKANTSSRSCLVLGDLRHRKIELSHLDILNI